MKGGDYVNLGRATICGLGNLFMYIALYSAQNIQSLMF